MSNYCHRLLDMDGNALVPEGFRVVSNEVDFVSSVLNSDPIVVRGKLLCRWASRLWRGRGLDYDTLVSPTEYLRKRWTAIDEQMACDLAAELGSDFDPATDPPTGSLLAAIYPNTNDVWLQQPSRAHLARWLLWLDSNEIKSYTAPIIEDLCSSWQRWCEEREELLLAAEYSVTDTAKAREVLRDWFGLDGDSATAQRLGVFPSPVPAKWIEAASNEWAMRTIERRGRLIADLQLDLLPRELAMLAAEETRKYLVHNPDALNRDVIKILLPYLQTSAMEELTRLMPPPIPRDVPIVASDVLAWYLDEYLPYRQWGAITDEEHVRSQIAELNGQFNAWFLQWYANMLATGSHECHFVASRSRQIRTRAEKDSIMFWVLLDGLAWSDAETILRLLQERIPYLSVQSEPLFTFVPTVTQFAKPAVISGTAPVEVDGLSPQEVFSQTFPDGRWLPENQHPQQALSLAKAGDLFCWSVSEPDKTYHQKADRPTTQSKIAAVLATISNRIADAVAAVPPEFALKVLLTTDHGRLLQNVGRRREVPDGMQAQCRAAWGDSHKNFPASGVVEEDGMLFLHAGRFGLADDCVVLVGDEAFLMADGKAGTEAFSHGGLCPEELVVPWVEIVRDSRRPEVRCLLTGRSRAGENGALILSAFNASETTLGVRGLNLRLGDKQDTLLQISGEIVPKGETSFNIDIERWPSKADCETVKAKVEVVLPSGVCYEIEADARIESEELYSRQPLLDDEF